MNGLIEKYGQTLMVIASLIVAVFAMAAFTHTATDSLHKRLDAQDRYIDQRFDAVDWRFDRLTHEVSELRRLIVDLGRRVSRNEGEIDVIRGHL